MGTRLITAPSTTPVTLAECKAQANVSDTSMDSVIPAFIEAAVQEAELETGRALMTQTWERTFDAFPDAIVLWRPPVQSVTSVKYYDPTNVLQTLNSGVYTLDNDSEPAWLLPSWGNSWPATLPVANAVRVRYVCGYADAASVPASIKQWIKMRVCSFIDESRSTIITGTIATDSPGVKNLLRAHTIRVAL